MDPHRDMSIVDHLLNAKSDQDCSVARFAMSKAMEKAKSPAISKKETDRATDPAKCDASKSELK